MSIIIRLSVDSGQRFVTETLHMVLQQAGR